MNAGRSRQAPGADRVALLRRLAQDGVDVAVIGGGINGAGIARAAALRGYSVLLVEKHDYGWGTTWRSTKLIHGGLRYLEHGEVGLVFESLRDRSLLLARYPGMVRPLRFLLPVFEEDRHGPAAIGLGLTAYDALSYRLRGPRLPWHRRLRVRKAVAWEPALRTQGLRGAFAYSDCQAPYPERLCFQTIAEAQDAGAWTFNHAAAERLLVSAGRVHGLVIWDQLAAERVDISARLVINAAGPWVDAVLRSAGRLPRQLGGTKGVHIVADFHGRGPRHALYAEARSDHRPFFVIPWRGRHLVGTTDTRFDGDPDTVRAEPGDIAYLVRGVQWLLPGAAFSPDDVVYAYAGVRPLPRTSDGAEGAITRRHHIVDHAPSGFDGLLSIVGGKLSTFRSLAAQVEERIVARLGKPSPSPAASAEPVANPPDTIHGFVKLANHRYLRSLYGPRLPLLLDLLRESPELQRPLCAHGPDVEGQVVFAATHEQATTLPDALLRRTGAGWNPCHALDCARRAADLMARELGWGAARIDAEIAAYVAELRRTFTSRVLDMAEDNVQVR